jgi:hypothetical protein
MAGRAAADQVAQAHDVPEPPAAGRRGWKRGVRIDGLSGKLARARETPLQSRQEVRVGKAEWQTVAFREVPRGAGDLAIGGRISRQAIGDTQGPKPLLVQRRAMFALGADEVGGDTTVPMYFSSVSTR